MDRHKKELIFSRDQIIGRVKELAEEISNAYAGRDVVLVGVLNGAFIFMSDLVKEMSIPLQIDFVRLSSYGASSVSSGKINMTKDVELDISGKHILIIEDIADSGITLTFLKAHLEKLGAESVKICAFIDKKERRTDKVHIDFTGFQVQQGFLVGYGLDYNENFRYLPEIYHLHL